MLSERGKNKIKRDRRKKTVAITLRNNLIFEIDNLSKELADGNRSCLIEKVIEDFLKSLKKRN